MSEPSPRMPIKIMYCCLLCSSYYDVDTIRSDKTPAQLMAQWQREQIMRRLGEFKASETGAIHDSIAHYCHGIQNKDGQCGRAVFVGFGAAA